MAQLGLAAAGATIGFIVTGGNPMGAQIGWALGATAGAILFPPKGPHSEGPRLNDRAVQLSTYGAPIPRVYGTFRCAGNVFWAKELEEVRTTVETGDKGGPTATSTTYSYFGSFAIAFCQGPVAGINRVWADGKLVYENAQLGSGKYGELRVHLGTEDQLPDATIQADKGVANTPAFRGTCYMTFVRMPLADFGNRLPNITAEIVASDDSAMDIVPAEIHWETGNAVFPALPLGSAPYGHQWRSFGSRADRNGATYWNDYNYGETGLILDANGDTVWTATSDSVHAIAVAAFGIAPDDNCGRLVWAPVCNGDYVAVFWQSGSWDATVGCMIFEPITGPDPTPLGMVRYVRQDAPPYNGANGIWQFGLQRVTDPLVLTGGTFFSATHAAFTVWPSPQDIMLGKYDGGWDAEVTSDFTIGSAAFEIPVCYGIHASTAGWGDWLGNAGGRTGGGWMQATLEVDLTTGLPLATSWIYSYFSTEWCNDRLAEVSEAGDAARAWPDGFVARWQVAPQECTFAFYANTYHRNSTTGAYVSQRVISAPEIVADKLAMPWSPVETVNPVTGVAISDLNQYGRMAGYAAVDASQPFGGHVLAFTEHFDWGTNLPGGYDSASGLWYTWVQVRVFLYDGLSDTFTSLGRFVGPAWQGPPNPDTPGLMLRNDYAFAAPDPATGKVYVYSTLGGAGIVKSEIGTLRLTGTADLAEIVADLTEAAGLSATQYDVSDLSGIEVLGYLVGREVSARGAIEPLMGTYLFDGYESDGKLKYRRRGGASALSLVEDELGATSGGDPGVPVQERRRQDIELPASVTLRYASPSLDYQPATASFKRVSPAFRTGDPVSTELPLVMADAEAAERASLVLGEAWLTRTTLRFALPPARVALDPTDVVTVSWGDNAVSAMLLRVDFGADGVLECEAHTTDAVTYQHPPVESAVIPSPEQTVGTIQDVTLAFLDVPLLRDQDDSPGFYLAASGETETWKGGTVYRDIGGTASFEGFASVPLAAPMGTALTALGTGQGQATHFDATATVDVSIPSGLDLESRTKLEVLAGYNVCLLGSELVGFTTATQLTATSWRLSTLLRGIKGTDWAMANHVAGERFVLLRSDGSTLPVTASMADLDVPRTYRGVSAGGLVEDAADVVFAPGFERLRPLSPVHVSGSRDGSGDLTITWVRRARVDQDWRDLDETPLDEPAESYEIDVMDGSTVLRTLTAGAASVSYSAAQQTTDFGGPQSSVTVRIYQMSSRVGRGHGRSATV